jgi:hypothetical protein
MTVMRSLILMMGWLTVVGRAPLLLGQTPVAIPVDGEPFKARLQSVSDDGKIHLLQAQGKRVIAAADLVRWGQSRRAGNKPHVILADGSLLVAEIVRLTGDHLVVQSDLWQETLLPLESIRGILLKPSSDPVQRDRWLDRIRKRTEREDTLYLQNKDTVEGVLAGFAKVSAENLEQAFQMRSAQRAAPLRVPVKNVVAVGFNTTLVRKPVKDMVKAGIGFREGSWLQVLEIAVQDDVLECELSGSIRIKTHLSKGSPWDQVAMIRPVSRRVVYLGDLPSVDYRHIPFLDIQWPFHVDRNVVGGQLRVAGQLYRKGIGMHSTSRLAYDIPPGYDRFQVEVGIDDHAQKQGSVVFAIYLQRPGAEPASSSWQRVTSSPIMRGGQGVHRMNLSLGDARRLALVVECSDQGDQRDLADWLNARFLRSAP